jgi:hypothetical protein
MLWLGLVVVLLLQAGAVVASSGSSALYMLRSVVFMSVGMQIG